MTRIAELLARRDPVVNVLEPEQKVARAVQLMADRGVGAVLVAGGGKLVGIFTERDLVRLLAEGREPANVALRDAMTAAPLTAEPDDDAREAVAKMQRASCRHLPILVRGQAADTLSMRDLLSVELDERDQEVEELHSYIRGERTTNPESDTRDTRDTR